jgi:transcriptional regulator with XRE-family HTH domain
MSTTADLITVIKRELKTAGITYAQLASALGMAESSVKRMLSQGDMPLTRIDAICQVLRTDFAELSRRVADQQPARHELTLEQERAVVADRKLLLAAICCLSQWTFEQVMTSYRYDEAELVRYFVRLDRLGVIELKPLNRYRLRLSKTFRWRPMGPVMDYFRRTVVPDYYAGGFDGEGELLTLVHGEIGHAQVSAFHERLTRVAQDFAQQHLADQRLAEAHKRPYTLVIGMRSWLFGPFAALKRTESG